MMGRRAVLGGAAASVAAAAAAAQEASLSPGFADARMHVFEARGLVPVPQRLEVGEQIEVVLRSEAELEAMVRSGTMVDGKTIGAFTLWKLGAGGGRA